MFQRRNLVHPMMEAFDGADLNLSCERRATSITAPQALSLFNGEFAHTNSHHLAARVCEHSPNLDERVEFLFRLTISRPPAAEEAQACRDFITAKTAAYKEMAKDGAEGAAKLAWRDASLALINTNEFLYLD